MLKDAKDVLCYVTAPEIKCILNAESYETNVKHKTSTSLLLSCLEMKSNQIVPFVYNSSGPAVVVQFTPNLSLYS